MNGAVVAVTLRPRGRRLLESRIGGVPTPVSCALPSSRFRLSPLLLVLLAPPRMGSSTLRDDARKGELVDLLSRRELNVIPRRPGVRQRAGLLERRVGQGRLWCRRVTGLLTCPAPWLLKATHGEQLESSPCSLSSPSPTSSSPSAGACARVDGTSPIPPMASRCASIAERRPSSAAPHDLRSDAYALTEPRDVPTTTNVDMMTVVTYMATGVLCSLVMSLAQFWLLPADGDIAQGGLGGRGAHAAGDAGEVEQGAFASGGLGPAAVGMDLGIIWPSAADAEVGNAGRVVAAMGPAVSATMQRGQSPTFVLVVALAASTQVGLVCDQGL